jgi:hypothetical protein
MLVYAILKYLAYVGWCAVLSVNYSRDGVRTLRPWRMGLIRIAIGIVVGLSLSAAGMHLAFGRQFLIAWTSVMIPVRWLEWSLLVIISTGKTFSLKRLLLGFDLPLRLWQAGGVLVSFLTDGAMIIAFGVLRALIC